MEREQALRQLWKLAFGDPDSFLDGFFRAGFSPDRCRYLTEGETVTSALYWLDCQYAGETYAYLYAVATHPEHRGQGLCRRLMAETHAFLKNQGYAGVLLVPQEESLRKFYGSMGYETATSVSEFTCAPAEEPVPIREIGPEEYGALRRQYLPVGGALQEGASVAFLETYAKFYAGQDFLLAAFLEEQFLWGMELLGNRDAAPGILKALNRVRGQFRTPGQELPFAMFLPLKEGTSAPGYLGHCFD